MKNNINKFVYWAPRILSIVFICFLALFSLDIFERGLGFWKIVIGLFIHNIPSLILLIILIISWKREIVGGVVFILAGISYIIMILIGGKSYQLFWTLPISGPAFLIGILFLFGWRKRKSLK
ncbi:MAG: hypothetical protein PHH83_04930 [Patescibacteria group bacterium]|nr:hypothetical protein [Patescibacteria group bacterium]